MDVLCLGTRVSKVSVDLLEGKDCDVQDLVIWSLGLLVCQVLVQLLEDEDGRVQGLAVRCPGPLVGEDPSELL